MKFIQGYPREEGATDMMDSARLAGLVAMCESWIAVDLGPYVQGYEAVRCPIGAPANNPKNFTRDQLICLAAGLSVQGNFKALAKLEEAAMVRGWRAQNTEYDVPGSKKPWYNGADLLLPQDRYFLRMCQGFKGSWFGKLMLKAEIVFNGWFTPLREPNQLIAKCLICEELEFYKKTNKRWAEALHAYWGGWRNEPYLYVLLEQRVSSGGKANQSYGPVS